MYDQDIEGKWDTDTVNIMHKKSIDSNQVVFIFVQKNSDFGNFKSVKLYFFFIDLQQIIRIISIRKIIFFLAPLVNATCLLSLKQ